MYDQHSQALPPTCPFRDRIKKALRLIRDLVCIRLIFALCRSTRLIPTPHGRNVSYSTRGCCCRGGWQKPGKD
ncbi:hypothetical protein BJY04DRAFT_197228 [Aspergillus karnatakaensis]|uniref:uncharacterized protein n=1 Tax=Aspergillus karnatakaensis TaxID=1810916 RepID=UPI003CCDBBFB